ncbi:hypothetical protein J2W51_000330 [Tardiphaga robiniae]|nr:hypothetical protein [Tardiphaga robiniae]
MVSRVRFRGERKEAKSRVTNGKVILPYQDGRSLWARIMRDSLQSLVAHCGGEDLMSETRRMAARRVAALEAELIMMEDRIASIRGKAKQPPPSLLQLYGMLADRQRRLSEALGWDRSKKPVNDIDLASYIRGKARMRPTPMEAMDHE